MQQFSSTPQHMFTYFDVLNCSPSFDNTITHYVEIVRARQSCLFFIFRLHLQYDFMQVSFYIMHMVLSAILYVVHHLLLR